MTDEAALIAEEWANEEPPVQLIVGADGKLVRRSAQSRSVRSLRSAFQAVFLPQGFPRKTIFSTASRTTKIRSGPRMKNVLLSASW